MSKALKATWRRRKAEKAALTKRPKAAGKKAARKVGEATRPAAS